MVLLASFIAFLATVRAASVLEIGCSSLSFPLGPSCFMFGAVVMPRVVLPTTGSETTVHSPEECQANCLRHPSCYYFVYQENLFTGVKDCQLKPEPSALSVPVMSVKTLTNSSRFRYVSGPKYCGLPCASSDQLSSGCLLSSPTVCRRMGKIFDPSCLTNPAAVCSDKFLPCCRNCADGSCCRTFEGVLLQGGEGLGVRLRGVHSPEHCHAQCLQTPLCTHWNFLRSPPFLSLGGSCYMRRGLLTDFYYESAPNFLTSVVGSADCDEKNRLSLPEQVKGVPVEGTCFESGVDVLDSMLYKQWGFKDAASCQDFCKAYPSCVAFVFNTLENGCFLKYSLSSKSPDLKGIFLYGPRDCTPEDSAPLLPTCLRPDMDIAAPTLVELFAVHAANCSDRCRWNELCQGWVYFNDRCYLKAAPGPFVPKLRAASGDTNCQWPLSRRMLLPFPTAISEKSRFALPTQDDSKHFTAVDYGQPSSWYYTGGLRSFVKPAAGSSFALSILADEEKYCSVINSISGVSTCWTSKETYLPTTFHLQVIGVAEGFSFEGWSAATWLPKHTSLSNGHLELFNSQVTIDVASHGAVSIPIDTSTWPEDFSSPLNFVNGSYYGRIRRILSPSNSSSQLVFCFIASDGLPGAVCLPIMVIPPA